MNNNLISALSDPLWIAHKAGDKYEMDGEKGWILYYYPIFEDGKSGWEYKTPRALMFKMRSADYVDCREVPLRFIKRCFIAP